MDIRIANTEMAKERAGGGKEVADGGEEGRWGREGGRERLDGCH